MELNMNLGYLFRLLGKNKLLVLDGYLFYLVVYERLKLYLEKLYIDKGEIFYSLRRGCVVIFFFFGFVDVEKNILGYIGWFFSCSFDRYSEMKKLIDVGLVFNMFV